MSHLVSKQSWGVIDLDTHEGRIFFQQDWYYHWITMPGVSHWTIAEKRHFHNTLDRQIWARWSNRIRLRVAGATSFAHRFAAHGVPINFDIHWVLHPGDWTVTVRKMPAGSTPTSYISNVNFASQTINLDSADFSSYSAHNDAGANHTFLAIPHEYGHTLDNPDEYNAGSPNLADTDSTMNIGNQIRARHLHLIVAALNALTHGCVWTAP